MSTIEVSRHPKLPIKELLMANTSRDFELPMAGMGS
jgi:hypothetical protein